ncbi:hypothetical protein BCR35DRAFT_322042 [Leucosporidium creatinivorum]|uniref:SUN domain-containing protein n=1 Tax=Leucosporidium creatinivorum TaxID=106004 RepID=A0A1Y2EPM2_9BASI|nr:hypothetical protein BCR35DRAFT_322042 [Leucosporidium creatinivorum]
MEEGDFNRHDDQEDDDATPAPTSYFLRLKSPSPVPSSSTNPNANANVLSPGPGAHSPFQPSRIFGNPSSTNAARAPSVDPILSAFDNSLLENSTSNSNSNDFSSSFHLHSHSHTNGNGNGDRSRRSPSFDASIISVRTDHDYEEEERIVRALEEQKRAGVLGRQGGGTGLRRRMPGPPGTSGASSGLGGIREEPEGAGAGVGKRLGEGVRPLWRGVERVAGWARNPLIDWWRVWKALALVGVVLWVWFAMRSTTPVPSPPPSSRSSWNPFRSSPPPAPFIPPSIPADSLPSLITRLTLLESAMGELSTLTTSDRTHSSSDRQLLGRLGEQVGALESGLEKERKGARKASEEGRELERTVLSVRGDLEALVSSVRALKDDRQADAQDLRKLHSNIQEVGKEIASLGTQVAQVSKDVRDGVDGERIARIALEAIEQVLPSKLAVRMNEMGKLEIDPAFWRYLKEAFAGRKEVEGMVRKEVGAVGARGSSSSFKEKEPSQVIVKEPPSWDDFLAANEVSLRSWVTSDLASRMGADAIVSKRTFLEMLKKELKTLKTEFELKANENVEKIGQELLSKVAKQEEMKKKDSIASHLNPFHRSPSSNPSTVTVKTPDGQNLTSIITTLVDSALLRYSKDVLARPDFALYTAGARVIRSLTSPTYSPQPLTRSRRALAWITGTHLPQGRAPITALHPDTSPGACWPFEGQQGQLGIQLSRRVVPSDVSIEHVSVDVAVDGEVRSAPREWEMWGVVEGKEDVKRLEEYRREARSAAAAGSSDNDDALEKALSTSVPPTPNHLLLAQGIYDTTLPSPVQTFPVTSEARQLAIPVQTVVLRVRSNHGERAFTCLYRVRVSGRTEEMVKRAATEREEA